MVTFHSTVTDTLGATTTVDQTVNTGGATGLRTIRRSFLESRINFGSTTDDTIWGPSLGAPEDFNQIITGPATLGTTMTMMRDCQIVGVRLYKSPTATGSVIVGMWNASGTLLASKTVTWTSDEGGWRTVTWDAPVSVTNTAEYSFGYFYPNADTNYAASMWVWNNGQDTTVWPFLMKQYASTSSTRVGGGWRVIGGTGLTFSSAGADRVAANYYIDPIAEWSDDTPGYTGGTDYWDQFPNGDWFTSNFPIIVFWPNTSDMAAYQDAGINLIATGEGATQQYIDAFKRPGCTQKWMPVLHLNDMSGPIVAQDDPVMGEVIVGYFVTDEPEFNQNPWYSPATTETWRDNARKIDATRPMWLNMSRLVAENQGFHWAPAGVSAFNKELQWREYAAQSDVGSLDIYGLAAAESFNQNVAPGAPNRYGVWIYPMGIKRMIELTDGRVPIWGIVESTSEFPARPTPEQVKRAVWSMLIAGARGIEYFDHRFADADVTQDFGAFLRDGPMLSAITALNTQIQSLKDALFAADAGVIDSFMSTGTLAFAQGGYAAGAKIPVHYTSRVADSKTYIFAQAIRSGQTTATFVAPSIAGATLTVIGESRTVTVDGSGHFTDTFGTGSGDDYAYHLYSTSTLPSFSAPVNTVAPALTTDGSPETGDTISSNNGTWTGLPTPTFSYQWQRDGANISGATASSYTLQVADETHSIRCRVTATNSHGSASANSNAVTAAAAPAPSITVAPAITTDGTPQTGETVACSSGTWTGAPSFAYQWRRNGTNISGATSSSYVLQVADEGQTVLCRVTATNGAGSTSADSGTITPAPAPSATAYRDAVLALSPTAFWRWESGALTDLGPHGFDLTAEAQVPSSASALTHDTAAGSKHFTSQQQGFLRNDDALLRLTSTFSLTTWLQVDPTSVSAFHALTKVDHYTLGTAPTHFTARVFTSGGNFWDADGATSININELHMVTFTYDGTNVRLYVDDHLDGTSANTSGALISTSNPLYLGKVVGGQDGWWGSMGEVALWSDHVLTLPEIQALYAAGTA